MTVEQQSVDERIAEIEAADIAACRLFVELIAEHEENITQLNERLKTRDDQRGQPPSRYWMALESNVRSSAQVIATLQHAIRRIGAGWERDHLVAEVAEGFPVGSVLPELEQG